MSEIIETPVPVGAASSRTPDASAPGSTETSAPGRGSARPGVHDMTQGAVRGHVLRMMAFMLTGMALQTLYSLVDIYWVGQLGKQAVAAVALSTNLMFVSLAASQALSVGCVALVSRAAGQKNDAEVQRLFNQAQCLAACVGVVFLGLCLTIRTTYTQQLAGDPETAALANEFLLGFIPALALQFTMIGLGSALRGIGDMRPGLMAQTGSVLLNLVLAPVLVFGWGFGKPLGVFGAALATFIATVCAIIGLATYMFRGKAFLKVDFAQWVPDFGVWRRMLAIGVPSGVEFLLLAITIGSSYYFTRGFGPETQAGFGIGSRIMQAGFMPAVAISFSVAAVAGQNFGAQRFDRVRATMTESIKLVLVFMVFITLVCQFTPEPLIRLFSDSDEVVAAGVDYLKTISLGYVANGIIVVSAGIFQGIGNTWPSLVASLIRAVAFIVPVSWLSGQDGFVAHSVWLGAVISIVVQLVVQQALLRRELGRRAPLPTSVS
jgi:putative MATE family efflux protein